MKRLITFFVAIAFAGQALAYDFKSGDLYYDITSDTTVEVAYEIYADKNNYSGLTNAVIPETVTNNGVTYAVSGIGYCAFDYCSGLTSVTIPNSVKSIEGFAFAGCFGLTSLTIPNSVNTIGDGAFCDCNRLTSVNIPNSVQTIGKQAFKDCIKLTKAEFSSIESLCNIKFTDDNSNPLNLAGHLYINGVEVTEVIIPDGVTSINDSTFINCISLTSVTIPNSVTSIGVDAFNGCIRLKTVNIIGDSITSIGDYAFAGCSSMTTITIPSSVTSIGEWAFSGCWGLTEIVVKSANTNYASENGVLFNKDKTTIICYPASKTGATYTIPNSVTSIGECAFYHCSGLTAVTIPESVTSISARAFYNCISLTAVTIPSSVTSIGDGAFADCSGLTTVTIPSSVTTIGYGAFQGCSSLTAVTIPSSVTIIGNGAFAGCSGLTTVTIPKSVTDIGAYAFKDCSGLTSVTIPNSVEYIDVCAFTGCSATIYCEFESQPDDWNYGWNDGGGTVVWEYKSTENQGGNEQGGENPGGNGNNIGTAVAENAANTVNIYAYGRNIVVENATEEIIVYDAMGRPVCRDAARHVSTITVNGTGIYIVKVGDIAKRVVIN